MDALAASGGARYDYLNEGALVPNPPEGYGASGVNWSTFVTGASATHYGVVDNSFSGSNFAAYPHFFQHVKEFDSSLYTASFANWTPINTHITPDQYADIEIGYDTGTGVQQDADVRTDAVSLISGGDPDVMFLQFDHVDGAGHAYSWGSSGHLHAIEVVDGFIGDIMAAINARPGVVSAEEDWLVLVSADHGAAEGSYGHYASQGPENWEVPFIISGPSVEDGVLLQQGTLRDLTSTALWHLGIDPFLAGLDGTIRGLAVSPPNGIDGDINQDGAVAGNGAGPAATDDVTAFLDNWMASGHGGVEQRFARGDLNLDGVTDLADWALLNRLNPALGEAVFRSLQGNPAPEPEAALLIVALASTLLALRQR